MDRRYIPRFFVLLCLLVAWSSERLSGQSPHFAPYPSPDNFNPLLIIQDQQGLIWVGGDKGLMMFDGLKWKAYNRPDSLDQSAVSAIHEAADQTMWIGYEDGLIMFLNQGTLHPFSPPEGLPQVKITGLLTDAEGGLWIGSYGEGLYIWQQGRLFNINSDDGLPDDFIYDIEMDRQNRIWAATDRGIGICIFQDRKKRVRTLTKSHGLSDDIITSLTKDEKGEIWVGTYEGGVCKYMANKGRFRCTASWEYGAVTSLLPRKKEVLAGTDRAGLVSVRNWHTTPVQGGQKGKVYQLYQDYEDNIWLIDHLNGLQSAHSAISFLERYPGAITSIHVSQEGKLLFFTEGKLVLFAPETGEYERVFELPQLHVTSIYVDTFQGIWIGTLGSGVWHKRSYSNSFIPITEKQGLINDHVLSIDGSSTEVWLATFGGASRMILDAEGQVSDIQNFSEQDGLGINYIYRIYLDRKGRTWFATDGKGIRYWEKDSIRHFDQLDGRTFYGITEDAQGRMWFSCADSGLFYYDGQQLQKFDLRKIQKPLPIMGIASDQAGQLLVVHESGINLIHPDSRSSYLVGNGMALGKSLNNLSSGSDGTVWIGSPRGVIRYQPTLQAVNRLPKSYIQDILVYLSPLEKPYQLDFAYDQNHIAFDYIGLWYRNPEAVNYQYRLTGQHQDWISSQDTRAIYPNLPPGDYTFELRSATEMAFSEAPITQFSFTIHPPFWRSWWFAMVFLGSIGTILFFLVRYREEQLKLAERRERDKLKSEFEILKNQINPHFLFNSFNTLVSTIEDDPKTAVGYVERLSDFFRSILEVREENVISLEEELSLLDNFYQLQKHRYGDNFQLVIDIPSELQDQYIAPLTLQLLVENAIKHNIVSSRKPLKVEIFQAKTGYLSVRNNLQLRRKMRPSTQLGLTNIRERYKLLGNRKVEIIQDGRYFSVDIPLLNQETS